MARLLAAAVLLLFASAAPARWEPPCISEPSAYQAPLFFREVRRAGVGAGFTLQATAPTTATISTWHTVEISGVRTLVLSDTVQPLAFVPYTVGASDDHIRIESAQPFYLYSCDASARPFVFLPIVRR